MRQRHQLGYMLLTLLSAAVSQAIIMLAAGDLPLPKEWLPFAPILSAALTALSTQLPAWQRGAPRR